MKIASLLSSATEIVFDLGLGPTLVAISHECDHPPEALTLPRLSRPRFDPARLSSAEIDAAVARSMEEFGSVYAVDADELARLAPDVVLTQAVCEVCAVPTGSVEAAVSMMGSPPRVVSLDAHTLDGILQSIEQVAASADVPERGRELVAELSGRLERTRERVGDAPRPRVLALEWLDPPFVPGHWIPEMIEAAGGENVVGQAGEPSVRRSWSELADQDPDVLLLLPCGYDLAQARADAEAQRQRLMSLAPRAFACDRVWLGEAAYFSRSGPRVFDGVEALAAAFHPDMFAAAALRDRLELW